MEEKISHTVSNLHKNQMKQDIPSGISSNQEPKTEKIIINRLRTEKYSIQLIHLENTYFYTFLDV